MTVRRLARDEPEQSLAAGSSAGSAAMPPHRLAPSSMSSLSRLCIEAAGSPYRPSLYHFVPFGFQR